MRKNIETNESFITRWRVTLFLVLLINVILLLCYVLTTHFQGLGFVYWQALRLYKGRVINTFCIILFRLRPLVLYCELTKTLFDKTDKENILIIVKHNHIVFLNYK